MQGQNRSESTLVDLEAEAITRAFPSWRFHIEWDDQGVLCVTYDAYMPHTTVTRLRHFIKEMVPRPKFKLERMVF